LVISIFLVLWIQDAAADPDRSINQVPADDPIALTVREIAEDIGNRMGRPLRVPIVIEGYPSRDDVAALLGSERTRHVLAYTLPVVPRRDASGRRQWVPRLTGVTETCLILLFLEGVTSEQRVLRSLLAHEVFHCFQLDIVGADASTKLGWLFESTAFWAGEEYVGGTRLAANEWNKFLGQPASLFNREYDGHGFFFHLQNNRVNVWRRLVEILRVEPNSVLDVLRRDIGWHVVQRLPMGLARQPVLGPEWDMDGPEITDARRPIETAAVSAAAPLTKLLEPGEQLLLDLSVPRGTVITFNITGFGAIAWGYGAGRRVNARKFGGALRRKFCVEDSCVCSDGRRPPNVGSVQSERALLAITATAGPARIAVTSGPADCTSMARLTCDPVIEGLIAGYEHRNKYRFCASNDCRQCASKCVPECVCSHPVVSLPGGHAVPAGLGDCHEFYPEGTLLITDDGKRVTGKFRREKAIPTVTRCENRYAKRALPYRYGLAFIHCRVRCEVDCGGQALYLFPSDPCESNNTQFDYRTCDSSQ